MGFEFGWLKNVLPKAMVLGLLIAGLFVILFEPRQGADTVPSIAKQSYDYWTGGAQPFSISRQSQSAGDKVWIVELANNENDSIEFYGVCAIGEGGIVNWTFNDSSRFGPNESKVLLIPAPKTCQNNARRR